MTPALNIECLNAATILDTLPDGAYITDTDRKIVFWNRAAEAITEWPRDEVAGRHCRDNILVHEDKDGHPLCGQDYCPLYRAIVTGESVNVGRLVFAQSKSGRRVAVEVTVSPLRDGRGTVVGGIEVFRDLSPMMEDLKRARAIQQSELALELPGDSRIRVAVKSSPVDLVGGDFHRVEALEGGRYSLMVADVTGHGVASALYSMQIRSLWDGGRPWLDRPGELLSFMNRRLCGLAGETGEYFATAAATSVRRSGKSRTRTVSGVIGPASAVRVRNRLFSRATKAGDWKRGGVVSFNSTGSSTSIPAVFRSWPSRASVRSVRAKNE